MRGWWAMHCTHRPGILHFAHGMLDGLRPFFCPRYFCKLYLPRSIRQAYSWSNHSSLINPWHRGNKAMPCSCIDRGETVGTCKLGTWNRISGIRIRIRIRNSLQPEGANCKFNGRGGCDPNRVIGSSGWATQVRDFRRYTVGSDYIVYNIDSRPKGDRSAAGRSPSLFSGFSSNRTSRRSDKNTSRTRGLGQESDPRSNN